ncbi:hypothetical protein JXI42_12645 [bacterium]|nr:hypothetical protein [bacterium]
MTLEKFQNQDKLKPHKTSDREINDLLRLVKRDLKDAQVKNISNDRRFATAYNAVFQLATIVLYCSGYQAKGIGHHYTTFQVVKEILGKEYNTLFDYFDSCRAKRNIADYRHVGIASVVELDELISEAEAFYDIVIKWLKENTSVEIIVVL